MQFNEEQRRACLHKDGPCIAVAGPGSGKTAVVTQRVRTLVETHGVAPERILTITFTRSAALEMQERFYKLTASRIQGAAFGTFHAIFYRMLQSGNGPARFFRTGERKRLMTETLKQLGLPYATEQVVSALSVMGRVKNAGRLSGELYASAPFADRFPDIFAQYERLRNELQCMDYDDVAPDLLALFRKDRELLRLWRERFRYYQIDEYQDVSPVQEAIVGLLAAPENNLFVVGDDDQAIYGFRGGAPEAFQTFLTRYPTAARYDLNVNYRSHPAIVDAASRVIARNERRIPKRPIAHRKTGWDADAGVSIRILQDRERETTMIVDDLQTMLAKGRDLTKVAVLCRTNAEACALACRLREANVPRYFREKIVAFYDDPVARDVVAYLRFALAGRRADFYRIMNRPTRYLTRDCARSETVTKRETTAYYRTRPDALSALRRFWEEIDTIRTLPPAPAARFVLDAVGYRTHLLQTCDDEGYARALSICDRIVEDAAAFSETAAFLRMVDTVRAKAREPLDDAQAKRDRETGARLMTMHASKGLEFDVVYLPALNDGATPSRRAVSQALYEEERRMLYVAMTRARKRLILSCVGGKDDRRNRVSPFLTDLIACDKMAVFE